MEFENYLSVFRKAAQQLDSKSLKEKQIEIAIGIFLNSVCLKLFKKSWSNIDENPVTAETRIFFSVWINDSSLKQQKLFYNIHALKLRKLKAYKIESRKLAEVFRNKFEKFEHQWSNVSTNYGPLTLMKGWLTIDLENFERDVIQLSNQFLEIENLIEETLDLFKKKN